MLRRILAAWGALARTFGIRIAPLFVLMAFSALRLLVAAAMALDPLLFPRLRRTRVRAPIVIVGNPRTGTTFLQRYLDDLGVGAGMPLYRMLYPSLLLQALIRPFLPALERISPARWHNTAAHDTGLLQVETDDVAVFFRYVDGFFLYGFLLAWAEEDLQSWFDPEVRDTSKRDFDWLEALWRRSQVASGRDRVVAKLFSLSARLPAFLERWPDARVLYTLRDPVQVIPSGMSLVTGVLDRAFGFWSLPDPLRARYLERLYGGFVLLMRRFDDDWRAGRIPRDRVKVVHFERMMGDLEVLTDEILAFLDVAPDEAMREAIRETARQQRAYRSGHRYDLARFGLDEERIRRDCAFLLDPDVY